MAFCERGAPNQSMTELKPPRLLLSFACQIIIITGLFTTVFVLLGVRPSPPPTLEPGQRPCLRRSACCSPSRSCHSPRAAGALTSALHQCAQLCAGTSNPNPATSSPLCSMAWPVPVGSHEGQARAQLALRGCAAAPSDQWEENKRVRLCDANNVSCGEQLLQGCDSHAPALWQQATQMSLTVRTGAQQTTARMTRSLRANSANAADARCATPRHYLTGPPQQ